MGFFFYLGVVQFPSWSCLSDGIDGVFIANV